MALSRIRKIFSLLVLGTLCSISFAQEAGLTQAERAEALRNLTQFMGRRGAADVPNIGGAGGAGGGGGGGGSGSGSGGGSPQSPAGGQGGGQGAGQGQGIDQSGVNGINQASQDFQKQLADMTKNFQSSIQGLGANDNYLKQLQEASGSLTGDEASGPVGEPFVSQIVESIAQLNQIQQQYYQVLAGVYAPPIPVATQVASTGEAGSNINRTSQATGRSGGPLAQAMGAQAVEGDPIAELGKPGSRGPASIGLKASSPTQAYNPPAKKP